MKLVYLFFIAWALSFGLTLYIYPGYKSWIYISFFLCGAVMILSLFIRFFLKKNVKFHEYADELELLIKENHDLNEVIERLYVLAGYSFNNVTNARLKELVKMTELQYNIKISKR